MPKAAPPSAIEAGLAILVALVGAGLTLLLFYPGTTTHDALAVYDQAHAGAFGDWQPPLLGAAWVTLERLIGAGPKALFLPTITVYWTSFLIFYLSLRRRGARLAWLMLAIGFLPPTFALIGILWRDVIFATAWLMAAAVRLATLDAARPLRLAGLTAALLFFLFGVLIRQNAVFAAVPLMVWLVWPNGFAWRRLILGAVPVVAVLMLMDSIVTHRLFEAKRDHALHSILVFDLHGISHFSGVNVFPIDDWTPEQERMMRTECYDPAYWDAIWWQRCSFAMERINRDEPPGSKLFGSNRLKEAWLSAVLAHPDAYLRHRAAFLIALMTRENMVLFNPYRSGQLRFLEVRGEAHALFVRGIGILNENTPVFRGLPWLLLALGVGIVTLDWPNGRARAIVLALALSATIYAATYAAFGVAAEYRYVYWTALASLVATVLALSRRALDRPRRP